MAAASQPEPEHVQVALHGEVMSVRFLSAALYEHVVLDELQDEIREALRSHRPRHVVFDFGRVEFCSTALVDTLLNIKRRLGRRGGVVMLSELQTTVRSAFKVLGLDGSVFPVTSTVQEAIALLQEDEAEE